MEVDLDVLRGGSGGGVSGTAGSTTLRGDHPGGGGTQTVGGAAGSGGQEGSFGQGGNGISNNIAYAGGGGGYYGGGSVISVFTSAGGGSGYIGGVTAGSMQTGINSGNGKIEITFQINPTIVQTAGFPSGSSFPIGTTTNTFVFDDGSGDITTCSSTVTVNDNTPPSFKINIPSPVSVSQLGRTSTYNNVSLNGTGSNNVQVSPGSSVSLSFYRNTTVNPGAGGCPGCATQHHIGIAGGYFQTCQFSISGASAANANYSFTAPTTPGIYYINQSASWDFNCNNNAQFTSGYGSNTIARLVVGSPSNILIDDITVNNDPNVCGAIVTYPLLTATDNCEGATITQTGGLSSGSVFPIGTTNNTFEAKDASGNKVTFGFKVTVKDKENPVITGCAPTQHAFAGVNCSAAVPDFTATVTATDNCMVASALVITQSPAAGTSVSTGVTPIAITVTDASGNFVTCSTSFTVTDNTIPVITACAPFQNAFANANCSAVVPNFTTTVTATDNCTAANALIITQSPAAGTSVSTGSTPVTITVTDAAGNFVTCSTSFSVTDNTLPVITAPAPVSVSNDPGKCSASNIALGSPDYSDNCSGVNVSNNAPAVFPKGNTTVTWTATDAAGNKATATQMVTVLDNEKPVVNCPVAPATLCYAAGGTYTIPVLQASDNCGIASTTYIVTGATSRTEAGSNASGSFNAGTSTITWTVTDLSGNATNCQTVVMVNSPLIVSIADEKSLGSGVDINTVYYGYAPASAVTLTATVSGGSGSYTYKWSTGAVTAAIKVSPVVATTYTVTVTDLKGCSATASKLIKVVDVRCGNKMDKVTVCHNGNNGLCIDMTGVPDHLGHGDYLGNCKVNYTTTNNANTTANAQTEEQQPPLNIRVSPNPSSNYFEVRLQGRVNEKAELKVTDMLGRPVYVTQGSANQTYHFGERLVNGIYLVQVIQGQVIKTVKVVKGN